eukprot:TRINITY_DN81_c1_g2_i1.p1 TRINITY_DN81_c1_g2~~TRINITY_DN81_c1_g2_i1.p1  ORF type:complete len:272 (+),score=20.73 TRINITY_DN81_c1_g2_i1:105-818(+)
MAFDISGDENIWLNCARLQYKGGKLLVPRALYAIPYRKLCFKFHSMLQRANYMLSSAPLLVEGIHEVSVVANRLREATSACSDHRAASGRDAQVLLGLFNLQGAGAITFQIGREGHSPPIAGLPPGILSVRMLLDSGSLLICAMYGTTSAGFIEPCSEAASIRLTLNVASADSEVSMSCRGIPFFLDGRLRASTCKIHGQRFFQSSNWPVLCVLTLLEGEPSDTRPRLANASNHECS